MGFWKDLSRRGVVRTLGLYGALFLGALQIADLTFESLGFPQWAYRSLVVMGIVGFPVAAALSWIFDVRRTPGPAPAENSDPEPIRPQIRTWSASMAGAVGVGIAAAVVAFALLSVFTAAGPGATSAGAGPGLLAFEQYTFGGESDDWSAAVSPDGEWVAYVVRRTADLDPSSFEPALRWGRRSDPAGHRERPFMPVGGMSLSEDGRRLVVNGILELDDGTEARGSFLLDDGGRPPRQLSAEFASALGLDEGCAWELTSGPPSEGRRRFTVICHDLDRPGESESTDLEVESGPRGAIATLSPDGRWVIVYRERGDSVGRVHSARDGSVTDSIAAPAAVFLPSGRAVAHVDRAAQLLVLRRFDPETGRFRVGTGEVRSWRIPDQTRLVTVGDRSVIGLRSLSFGNLMSGQIRGDSVIDLRPITRGTSMRADPQLSRDGSMLASLRQGRQVVVHDLASGEEREVYSGTSPGRASWSSDGTRLALVDEGEIRIIDLRTGMTRRLPIAGDSARVRGVDWTADGAALVAVVADSLDRVERVDPESGATERLFQSGEGGLTAISSSPDAATLAISQGPEVVVFLDPGTGVADTVNLGLRLAVQEGWADAGELVVRDFIDPHLTAVSPGRGSRPWVRIPPECARGMGFAIAAGRLACVTTERISDLWIADLEDGN